MLPRAFEAAAIVLVSFVAICGSFTPPLPARNDRRFAEQTGNKVTRRLSALHSSDKRPVSVFKSPLSPSVESPSTTSLLASRHVDVPLWRGRRDTSHFMRIQSRLQSSVSPSTGEGQKPGPVDWVLELLKLLASLLKKLGEAARALIEAILKILNKRKDELPSSPPQELLQAVNEVAALPPEPESGARTQTRPGSGASAPSSATGASSPSAPGGRAPTGAASGSAAPSSSASSFFPGMPSRTDSTAPTPSAAGSATPVSSAPSAAGAGAPTFGGSAAATSSRPVSAAPGSAPATPASAGASFAASATSASAPPGSSSPSSAASASSPTAPKTGAPSAAATVISGASSFAASATAASAPPAPSRPSAPPAPAAGAPKVTTPGTVGSPSAPSAPSSSSGPASAASSTSPGAWTSPTSPSAPSAPASSSAQAPAAPTSSSWSWGSGSSGSAPSSTASSPPASSSSPATPVPPAYVPGSSAGRTPPGAPSAPPAQAPATSGPSSSSRPWSGAATAPSSAASAPPAGAPGSSTAGASTASASGPSAPSSSSSSWASSSRPSQGASGPSGAAGGSAVKTPDGGVTEDWEEDAIAEGKKLGDRLSEPYVAKVIDLGAGDTAEGADARQSKPGQIPVPEGPVVIEGSIAASKQTAAALRTASSTVTASKPAESSTSTSSAPSSTSTSPSGWGSATSSSTGSTSSGTTTSGWGSSSSSSSTTTTTTGGGRSSSSAAAGPSSSTSTSASTSSTGAPAVSSRFSREEDSRRRPTSPPPPSTPAAPSVSELEPPAPEKFVARVTELRSAPKDAEAAKKEEKKLEATADKVAAKVSQEVDKIKTREVPTSPPPPASTPKAVEPAKAKEAVAEKAEVKAAAFSPFTDANKLKDKVAGDLMLEKKKKEEELKQKEEESKKATKEQVAEKAGGFWGSASTAVKEAKDAAQAADKAVKTDEKMGLWGTDKAVKKDEQVGAKPTVHKVNINTKKLEGLLKGRDLEVALEIVGKMALKAPQAVAWITEQDIARYVQVCGPWEAWKRLESTIEWRQKINIDEIAKKDFSNSVLREELFWLGDLDKTGHPVLVFRSKMHQPGRVSNKEFIEYTLHTLENGRRQYLPISDSTVALVGDRVGSGILQQEPLLVLELLPVIRDHYPGTLSNAYIGPINWFLFLILAVFKVVIDAETAKRINLFRGDFQAQMRDSLYTRSLPVHMGGDLKEYRRYTDKEFAAAKGLFYGKPK